MEDKELADFLFHNDVSLGVNRQLDHKSIRDSKLDSETDRDISKKLNKYDEKYYEQREKTGKKRLEVSLRMRGSR